MPDWLLEQAAAGPVAGVDEVGRGCIAGAVAAAAVVFHTRDLPETLLQNVRDSKTVPAAVRAEVAAILPRYADIGLGVASPAEIDALNILQASLLAMRRAVAALAGAPAFALVDGTRVPDLSCPANPVIRGDSRSYSIAAASIVAKVWRDRQMQTLHGEHPCYGWNRNVGYPTAQHRKALQQYGVSPYHRQSFGPVVRWMEAQEPV